MSTPLGRLAAAPALAAALVLAASPATSLAAPPEHAQGGGHHGRDASHGRSEEHRASARAHGDPDRPEAGAERADGKGHGRHAGGEGAGHDGDGGVGAAKGGRRASSAAPPSSEPTTEPTAPREPSGADRAHAEVPVTDAPVEPVDADPVPVAAAPIAQETEPAPARPTGRSIPAEAGRARDVVAAPRQGAVPPAAPGGPIDLEPPTRVLALPRLRLPSAEARRVLRLPAGLLVAIGVYLAGQGVIDRRGRLLTAPPETTGAGDEVVYRL